MQTKMSMTLGKKKEVLFAVANNRNITKGIDEIIHTEPNDSLTLFLNLTLLPLVLDLADFMLC